jgi:hypothetical protein
MSKALLIAGGILNALFAVFHFALPSLAQWQNTLSTISTDSQAVMYTLNLAAAFTLLVFAFVSVFYRHDLLTTNLGKALSISIALFWLVRAVAEILYFRIGVNGSWVGVLMFGAIGFLYLISLFLIKPTQIAAQ